MTRSITIRVSEQTPEDMPAWVADDASCRRAWRADLCWRVNAAGATTAQYRRVLVIEARLRGGLE